MSPSSTRTVLVVGANRGIGLALCKRFKVLGREVIAAGRRSSSALDGLGARVELGVDVTTDDGVAALAQRLAGLARDRLGADGVNLLNSAGAAAWQSVFHFHIHVIPRYTGDPLTLPWVPAPAAAEDLQEAASALAG